MSGLVVLFDREDRISNDRIEAMLDSIDHRGPDGRISWRDEQVALGHQQLQSTPESRYDQQPYRDGEHLIVADARVDNRDELADRLSIEAPLTRMPDSHLLLSAYRKWGAQCVNHIVGSFAFVIWDTDAKTLFCARDRFGVKPIYYYEEDGLLAVASEIKALLTLPFVSIEVNDIAIGDFLVGLFEDKERTFYQEIRRLPPAHVKVINDERATERQYWDLNPHRTLTLESDAAYERRFRDLFEQAVSCRLRTEGRPGTSLSGGLDSSSITVTARNDLPDDQLLHTFSNVYDQAPTSDEREFIEAVSCRDGVESHYVFLDDVGSFGDRECMEQQYDRPPHDPMHHAIWERSKRANEVDVDVLLEGALGDSAAGYGLGLLPELLRTGRWRRLLRETRAMGEVTGAPAKHLLIRHAAKPLIPSWTKRMNARLRGNPVLEAAENPALNTRYARRIGVRKRLKQRDSVSVLRETARRRQYRSLLDGRMTASLETADLAAAQFGIEPRYPFTDVRLVEFSLAIPATQQLSDGWTRSILRRALADLLPEKIRARPWKTDMSEAFWNSLALEDDLIQRLLLETEQSTDYFDDAELRAAYERFSTDPNTQDAQVLWRALSLFTWFRSHKNRTGEESAASESL
ncbi:asparagine synthase (glutamine-hydrolyzing) [Halogeometricum sp. S1BR25-6]|uniref:Putative asparagine synthetase [glutamine-hydrolyzing] n=1 Tax=Halogeometricum salsisoli TaxID=2950536 RepID=A0ABU2GJI3_9EURY|nr:asparagine synthase (glutamine-hydrolyzing) [Halogeometricum sp. S1BR25-6]MDS0300233.1 asparagine synthase (glutamine-hydrolyzing) [Halogeometricum sp. S1BR25-6]